MPFPFTVSIFGVYTPLGLLKRSTSLGHWGLTSPREGEIRFTEHNDAQEFYQVAKDVGLLVIVRPGPYVNAETAGGGFYLGSALLPCLTLSG